MAPQWLSEDGDFSFLGRCWLQPTITELEHLKSCDISQIVWPWFSIHNNLVFKKLNQMFLLSRTAAFSKSKRNTQGEQICFYYIYNEGIVVVTLATYRWYVFWIFMQHCQPMSGLSYNYQLSELWCHPPWPLCSVYVAVFSVEEQKSTLIKCVQGKIQSNNEASVQVLCHYFQGH